MNPAAAPRRPHLPSRPRATCTGMPAWRPWTYDDSLVGTQLGGAVTEYEGDVFFATVHGAGHMVPQTRPQQALRRARGVLRACPQRLRP